MRYATALLAAAAWAIVIAHPALAADPLMTLRVAVNLSGLPSDASKYMVNCVVQSETGVIAQGSATGQLAHSPTPAGTYVGGFQGKVAVPLYQAGPNTGSQPRYSCSLLIVSTSGQICAASDACATNGGAQPWAQHKPGTPFMPTIVGALPAASPQ